MNSQNSKRKPSQQRRINITLMYSIGFLKKKFRNILMQNNKNFWTGFKETRLKICFNFRNKELAKLNRKLEWSITCRRRLTLQGQQRWRMRVVRHLLHRYKRSYSKESILLILIHSFLTTRKQLKWHKNRLLFISTKVGILKN